MNEAYRDIPFKVGKVIKTRRKLTKKGEKYKNETKAAFSRQYPAEMQLVRPNECTGWAMVLDMPDVLNKGWPEKAENRYKTKDASNRVKIIEDCLAESLAINDAQFFLQFVAKREGVGYTHIWVWNIEVEGWLPDGLVQSLQRLQPY